jgi:hypothetical protein
MACYLAELRAKPSRCKVCATTSAARFDAKSRSLCVACRADRERRRMAALHDALTPIDALPQCAPEPRGCEMKHHSVDDTGLCALCRLERSGRRLSDVLRTEAA